MRRLAAILAALLAAWVVVSVVLFVRPREDDPARADAVIVLAGAHSRLDTGVALVRRGVAPLLVISDGNQPGWRRANRLCFGRSRLAVRCFDPDPFSTHGEAQTIARLVRRNGWRRIVVVTSTYHVTRARMLLRRCVPVSTAVVGSRTSVWNFVVNIPWESAKLLWQVTLEREC